MIWISIPTRLRWTAVGLFVALLPALPAQQTASDLVSLRAEVDALRVNQRQLQREMQLIRNMLLGKQVTPEAPPLENVVISTAGSATMGSEKANVVVVEFTDYQCPFCARFTENALRGIVRDYVATGRISYVLRNLPIQEAHPNAFPAAEAAECAGEQGKYWEAHEKLFRNQASLGPRLLMEGNTIGLDQTVFDRCLQDGRAATRVKADLAEASRLGVDATPTFFLGYRDEADRTKVRALKKLTGSQPIAAFAQILEYLLDPPLTNGGNE